MLFSAVQFFTNFHYDLSFFSWLLGPFCNKSSSVQHPGLPSAITLSYAFSLISKPDFTWLLWGAMIKLTFTHSTLLFQEVFVFLKREVNQRIIFLVEFYSAILWLTTEVPKTPNKSGSILCIFKQEVRFGNLDSGSSHSFHNFFPYSSECKGCLKKIHLPVLLLFYIPHQLTRQ